MVEDSVAARRALLNHQSNIGGKQQRKRALDQLGQLDAGINSGLLSDSNVPTRFDSELGKELLIGWSWGKKSALEVQRLAMRAYRDEQSLLARLRNNEEEGSSMIKAIARVGNWGVHTNNANRDLKNYLGDPTTLPESTDFNVHVRISKHRRISRNTWSRMIVQTVLLPFLLPHVFFHHLYHFDKDGFEKTILSPSIAPRDFWTEVCARRDPRIQHHPMITRADWMDKGVALSLHTDAVPVISTGNYQCKSLDVFSWQSLFAAAESDLKTLKNLICTIFEDSKVKPGESGNVDTMSEIWRIIAWSLQALYEGKWPTHNHHGTPYNAIDHASEFALAGKHLADGYFGVVWGVKGDLESWYKDLGFPHYRCDNFCELDASENTDGTAEGDLSYNFRHDAHWKHTQLTKDGWRALRATTMHVLFELLEYLSCVNLEPDELHTMHLGTTMYFVGSILWLLVYRVLRGSPQENIACVWGWILDEYTDAMVSVQFPKLDLKSFTNNDPNEHYPKLKGKGGQIKHLLKPMLRVWIRCMNPLDNMHVKVRTALEHLVEMQRLIDAHAKDLFMTRANAAALKRATDSFLADYSILGDMTDGELQLLFNMVPNFHFLWHLAHRAFYLSPRRGSCWIDETFVGIIKLIGKACAAGTTLHRIPSSIMCKWRWGRHAEGLMRS